MTLVISIISIAMTMFLAPVIYMIFKYSIKERTYDDLLEEQRLRYAQLKEDSTKIKSLKMNSNTKKKQTRKRKQLKGRNIKFAKSNSLHDNDDISEPSDVTNEVIITQQEAISGDMLQKNDNSTNVEKAVKSKLTNEKNIKSKHSVSYANVENECQGENVNGLKKQQNVNSTKEKKILDSETTEKKSNDLKRKQEENVPKIERNIDDILSENEVIDKRNTDTKKIQLVELNDSKAEESNKYSIKEKPTKKKKEANNRGNGNKVAGKEFDLIRKNANGAIDVNMFVSVLNKVELSRSEIQRLIEFLLNKQQESSVNDFEWMEGKQDAVNKLKKQLADKEKALMEEQEALVSMQNKLKELRNEVNCEKTISKQLEQTLQMKQLEIQNMVQKIHILTEEEQTLKQQLREERATIEALNNEGANLELLLQKDVSERQQLELHISQLTEQHQQTMATMRDQITSQMHERDSTLSQLDQQVKECALLRERISILESQLSHLQELAIQLEETRKRANEIEHHFANSQFEITRLTEQLNSLKKELSNSQKECDTLKETMKNMKVENQEVNKENKRLNDKITTDCNELREVHKENRRLTNEIEKLEENTRILLTEQSNTKKTIGELEKEKEIIKEQLNRVSRLQNELMETVNLKEQQITKLANDAVIEKDKLTAQCKKNDELRSKNYKAMEAISMLENSLENKVKEIQITVRETKKKEQLEIVKKLSNIFTCVSSLTDKVGLDDLLEKLNDERCLILQNNSLSKKEILKLKEENAQLKSAVNEYKRIIFDTENTLHSLQKHVEEAETNWARQMTALKDQLNKKAANCIETDAYEIITMNGGQ